MAIQLVLVKTDGTGSTPPTTTWNPLDKGTETVLSNGDLTATCGSTSPTGYSSVRTATLIGATEKKICEVTFDSYAGGTTLGNIGVGTNNTNINDYMGHDNTSIGYFSNGNVLFNNSVLNTIATYTTGDTITMEIDRTTSTVAFYKNGTAVGSFTQTMSGVSWSPMVSNLSISQQATYTANFAEPFEITPTAGFTPITA